MVSNVHSRRLDICMTQQFVIWQATRICSLFLYPIIVPWPPHCVPYLLYRPSSPNFFPCLPEPYSVIVTSYPSMDNPTLHETLEGMNNRRIVRLKGGGYNPFYQKAAVLSCLNIPDLKGVSLRPMLSSAYDHRWSDLSFFASGFYHQKGVAGVRWKYNFYVKENSVIVIYIKCLHLLEIGRFPRKR